MRLVFLAIAAGLLPVGVASAAEPPKAASWILESGRDIAKRPARTPRLDMLLKELSGTTGCNTFTAAVVEKTEKRIAIEQVRLTRKLCSPEIDRVETALVRALDDTRYLEERDRKLVFLAENRQPLLVWMRADQSSRRVRHARAGAR